MENGRGIKIAGDPNAPLYEGYTCPKGRALPEMHYGSNRLLNSMKRGLNGHHEVIPVVQAMDEIAEKVSAIIKRHGPRSVALYMGTGMGSFFEMANVAVAWMKAIGSPMIFTSGTIDKPGANIAMASHGAWSAGHPPFEQAEAWMLVGLNPLISKSGGFPPNNPGRRLKDAVNKSGMKLIVIDPRATETSMRAHIHMQAKPGEDPAILAAMLNVIIAEKLYDVAFIADNVSGFEALKQAVAPFTPAYAAERADIPADQIVEAARVFAGARYAGAGCGTGPSFSLNGSLAEYLTRVLMTICGFWARAGDVVSKPSILLPAFTPRAEALAPFPAWGFGESLRVRGLANSAAGMPTCGLAEEILLEGDGKVRALFNLAGNPMMAWPDQKLTHKALSSLELLVTSDFEMGATARISDYVIAPKLSFETPVATGGLVEGLRFVGQLRGIEGPYGRYAPAIAAPPEGSDLIDDWELYHGLARRMGLPLEVSINFGMKSHAEAPPTVFTLNPDEQVSSEELLELAYRRSRVPLEEVKKYPHGHVFEDVREVVQPKRPDHTGRLDVGNPYMMESLQADLLRDQTGMGTSADYPLLLIPRRMNKVMNSSGQRDMMLCGKRAYNPAFLHPDDLAAFGLKPGAEILLRSRYGSIVGITAADPKLRRGCVSMAHSFGVNPDEEDDIEAFGSNTGRLTSVAVEYDPITGIARMGALPIRIEPITKITDAIVHEPATVS
jgi:anaerobic selenocysteine-containing dehydrogenase